MFLANGKPFACAWSRSSACPNQAWAVLSFAASFSACINKTICMLWHIQLVYEKGAAVMSIRLIMVYLRLELTRHDPLAQYALQPQMQQQPAWVLCLMA